MPDTEYKARLAARYRHERMFLFFGRASVAIATIILLILVGNLTGAAWRTLTETSIAIDITTPDSENEYYKALPSALLESGIDQHSLRPVLFLFSSAAAAEIKNYIDEHKLHAGDKFRLLLTASPEVDRWYKSGDVGTLNEVQQKWLEQSKAHGRIQKLFNYSFFRDADSREPEQAGMLGSVVGSLMTVFCCLLLALPLGVMSAIYLQEFAPQNALTDFIEININNLAAVPSIIFGLLGLSAYIHLMDMPRSSSIVGGFTLALMVLPTIVITTRTALRSVPDSIRDAARALGATHFQVTLHHVLPLAVPGIITGTILGISRAIGETAPLIMIGMVAFMADIPHKITDPATVMPVQIYLWANSPETMFVDKTALAILVLLLILAVANGLAAAIRRKFEHRW